MLDKSLTVVVTQVRVEKSKFVPSEAVITTQAGRVTSTPVVICN